MYVPSKHKDKKPAPVKPPADLRTLVLSSAGVSPEKMSELLQEALVVLQSKLGAEDTKFFAYQGEVQEERQVANHGIQLQAAESLVKVVTALAALKAESTSAKGSSQPTLVQINVPGASPPQAQASREEAPVVQVLGETDEREGVVGDLEDCP